MRSLGEEFDLATMPLTQTPARPAGLRLAGAAQAVRLARWWALAALEEHPIGGRRNISAKLRHYSLNVT
jgi:hypothetical protein